MRKFIYAMGWAVLLLTANLFGWDAEKNVSEYPSGRDYTVLNNTKCIALFGDTAYIVWERWVNDDVPSPLFSRFTPDNGATWSAAHNEILGDGHYTSIIVSGGVGHMFVYKCDPPLGSDHYRSTNSGQTWTKTITMDPLTNAWNCITADRVYTNKIHAVWQGFSAPYPYRYRRSLDNGLTWEVMKTLVSVSSVMPIPSIAAICDFVYLAYIGGTNMTEGDSVCFIRSADGGVTWTSPPGIVLGSGPLFGTSLASVCVACRNNYVYVVWNDGDFISGAKIKFKRSSDYGATFGSEQSIANGGYANLYALGPYVYMAYVGTDGKVKFRYSDNHGASWSAEQTAGPNADVGYTPGPSIVVSPSGHAHIAWTDSRYEASADTGEVFYVHGTVPVSAEIDTCGPTYVEEAEYNPPAFSVTNMPYGFYVRYDGKEPCLLMIYNIVGRLVKTQKITPESSSGSEVRLGELPSGIYFLALKTPTHYLRAKGVYLKY